MVIGCVVCRNIHRSLAGGLYRARVGRRAFLCVNMFMSICEVGYNNHRMCCI